MLGSTRESGHEIVDDPEAADVIVVNTCGFIDAAREESVDTILEMAQHRTEGSCEKLVVTGCLSQRYPEELAREIPEIDHILGSADYGDFRRVIADGASAAPAAGTPAKNARRLPVLEVSETPSYLYDHDSPRLVTGPRHSVFVKIAEGCDRPCAFCIIPKLRGPQRSRSIESVHAEVERMVGEGAREINLVAQDLTRYGVDLDSKPTLAALLRRLGDVRGLDWIRLHYTYPTAFSDELIETIAGVPAVVPYIDVPLQHIDDRVLKWMRRGHSSRVTRELVERLRRGIPDVVLRTTFIVGHPGETDEAYARLRDFVRETEFDRVGAFTYSPEEGTASYTLAETVPAHIAGERQEELMTLQAGISRRKLAEMVGRRIQVLVDGVSDESEFILQGRFYGQAPDVDGSVYLTDGSASAGDLVEATVTDASDHDLAASLALSAAG